jgi:broad specificity phosphatase PhoE
MLRLTLICSAPTEATRRSAFPRDEPLDARGGAAATALRRAWPQSARGLCSPARSARETAAAIGIAGTADPALRDLDYGRWSGMTIGVLAAQEPDALAAWRSDPKASPHGGESIAALFARTAAFLDGCVAAEGTLVAVTHAPVMRAAVALALAAPMESFWRIDIAPLARVRLHGDGTSWRLRSIGEWK